MKITTESIKEYTEKIKAKQDQNAKHQMLDLLFEQVLFAIADGIKNPQEISRTTLEALNAAPERKYYEQ